MKTKSDTRSRATSNDYSHRTVRDMDFSELDLTDARFDDSVLINCTFHGTTLVNASFRGASMDGVTFLGADARRCDFSKVKGDRIGFEAADLRLAELSASTFANSSFSRCQLEGGEARGSVFKECRFVGASLAMAELRSAKFNKCAIHGVNVDRADFCEASFSGCRIQSVINYESANWVGVPVHDVDFTGAYLLRRAIIDENYLHEFRARNRKCAVIYHLWRATSDCGRSFVRWFLWTIAITLVFAGVYSFVAIDGGSHSTPLTPLYFSVVTLTTLGYGDVLPVSSVAQAAVMIQVVVGYLALGGLLSIFANKMGRRGD